jgi:hypothetical protein
MTGLNLMNNPDFYVLPLAPDLSRVTSAAFLPPAPTPSSDTTAGLLSKQILPRLHAQKDLSASSLRARINHNSSYIPR